MSHAANIYVKKLKAAPNGDVIPASERAVLWYLADCHSEEAGGIAWPSMKTLAEHVDLGERQTRRLVTSLEEKGIIGRVAQTRENGSCQSNSFYFIELQALPIAPAPRFLTCAKPRKTGGKRTKNGAKPTLTSVEKSVEQTPPTLTPVSGGDDASVRETLTPVSPLEAPLEASSEAPGEQAKAGGDGDISPETTSKTKTGIKKQANSVFDSLATDPAVLSTKQLTVRTTLIPDPPHPGKWDAFKAELLRKLQLLPEKISLGYVDEFNATIRDTSLIDDSCDGDSMVPTWTISAADPDATRSTLAALASYVKSALWKTAKGDVQVRVYGGEE